jgi:death on curing protein
LTEPVWVTDREAVALNHRLIALFGGFRGGVRDHRLLEAALARPLNKWHYDEPRADLCSLAAAYAFAIARGHVFLDGNKRTGHAIAAVFLENNGVEHGAPEDEVVAIMIAVADGTLSEPELAAWFRQTSRPAAKSPGRHGGSGRA